MQNTKNFLAPRMVQYGNSTPTEVKTQQSNIDHSTNLPIPTLSPAMLLEQRLNAWYDQKEARQQQRLAQAQANPDQQYLYTTEENGYRYVYQVSIKLINTVEIQPNLVNPLDLDNQLDVLDKYLDTGLDNETSHAMEVIKDYAN